MPKYLFTARSTSGAPRSGELVAVDEKSLAARLREEGFIVTSIHAVAAGTNTSAQGKGNFLDRFTTIPLREKLFFTRNLGVMIASGLPVARSLANLALQTKNKRFQSILRTAYSDVQKGTAFSDALAKHPRVFDDLFVNMIRVGEIGGTMEASLEILTIQIEKEHALMSKVRGAMIYPAVILFAMILVGVLMLTYILPQILGVFEDMDVELPPMTLFVIGISDALRDHGVLIGLGLVLSMFGAKVFFGRPSGKRTMSWIVLHLPAIKNIVIKVNAARFARIYSSLIKSGVNVIEAMDIVADTLSNYYYRDVIHEGKEKIQKGIDLSAVVGEHTNLFPIILVQMIKVGEETGQTEEMLMKIATFYEDEVTQITKNMSSIIEPILMLVIGGAVGFFAVAMLQPMYSVLENI